MSVKNKGNLRVTTGIRVRTSKGGLDKVVGECTK